MVFVAVMAVRRCADVVVPRRSFNVVCSLGESQALWPASTVSFESRQWRDLVWEGLRLRQRRREKVQVP